MKNLVTKSILAGLLIAIAGAVYLRCENKIVGALLFSLGLYAVCELDAKLFTGVIGKINSISDLKDSGIILLFNFISAALFGIIYRICLGANPVFTLIVDNQLWPRVLFESILCGALIYIAVVVYAKVKNPFILILCVMGFILSGSLHSIACSFYFTLDTITIESIIYLLIIIIGNSIGALLVRFFNTGFLNWNK